MGNSIGGPLPRTAATPNPGPPSTTSSRSPCYERLCQRISLDPVIMENDCALLYPLWLQLDMQISNALLQTFDINMKQRSALEALVVQGFKRALTSNDGTLLIRALEEINKKLKAQAKPSPKDIKNLEAIIEFLRENNLAVLKKGIVTNAELNDIIAEEYPIHSNDFKLDNFYSNFAILRIYDLIKPINDRLGNLRGQNIILLTRVESDTEKAIAEINLSCDTNRGERSSLKEVNETDIKKVLTSAIRIFISQFIELQGQVDGYIDVYKLCLTDLTNSLSTRQKEAPPPRNLNSIEIFRECFWEEQYDFIQFNTQQFLLHLNKCKKSIADLKNVILAFLTCPEEVIKIARENSHRMNLDELICQEAQRLIRGKPIPISIQEQYKKITNALDLISDIETSVIPCLEKMILFLDYLQNHVPPPTPPPSSLDLPATLRSPTTSPALSETASLKEPLDNPLDQLNSHCRIHSQRLGAYTDPHHLELMFHSVKRFVQAVTPEQRLFYASAAVKEGFLTVERLLTKVALEKGADRESITHNLFQLAGLCKEKFSLTFMKSLQTLGTGEIDVRNSPSIARKQREELVTLSEKVLHSAHLSSQGKEAPLKEDLFAYCSTVLTLINHFLQHKQPDQYLTKSNLEDHLSRLHTSYILALSRSEPYQVKPHELASSLEQVNIRCEQELQNERIPFKARLCLENIVRCHLPACIESLSLDDLPLLQASSFFSSYHWLLENLLLATIHFNRAEAPSSSEHNLLIFANEAGISLSTTERETLEKSNHDRNASRYHFDKRKKQTDVEAQVSSAKKIQQGKQSMQRIRGGSSAGGPSVQESFEENAQKKINLLQSLLAKCQASWN